LLLVCSTAHRSPPPFPTRRSSDLWSERAPPSQQPRQSRSVHQRRLSHRDPADDDAVLPGPDGGHGPADRDAARQGRGVLPPPQEDRKSTRLNSSHVSISYAVFCLK